MKAIHCQITWTNWQTLAEIERMIIIETVKAKDGNRTHAAASLGVSIRSLRSKISGYREEGFDVP